MQTFKYSSFAEKNKQKRKARKSSFHFTCLRASEDPKDSEEVKEQQQFCESESD
jgi:hypothetical protein